MYKFISFEGGEGSGKSTQSKLLAEYFLSQNIQYIHTREPGGTLVAEQIREIYIHHDMNPTTELLMIMAARSENISANILPALENNCQVICDRFVDSTAVYQGYLGKIELSKIYEMHNKVFNNLMPDITFLIDIDVEVGLARAIERGGANRFENKGLEFHKLVRNAYLKIANNNPNRIKVIDGSQPVEKVQADILSHLRM